MDIVAVRMVNLAQGWINHFRRQARNDQGPPTDTVAPAPSAKDQRQQWLGDDKPDDVALRDPPEAVLSGDPGPEDDPLKCPFYVLPPAQTIRQWNLMHVPHLEPTRQVPLEITGKVGQSPDRLAEAYRARERRYMPLVINGKVAYGLPDTALIGNAMTEDWARSIGAKIDCSPDEHLFVNAKGSSFQSIGTTQVVVSIPGSPSHDIRESKWTCSFAVVKHLSAPLVLGKEFLRTTKILTSLAPLLVRKSLSVVKRPLDGLKTIWRFMHMDLRTQQLNCLLDNREVFVSLDTGSDNNVVSLTYAKSRGWEIQPLSEAEAYVQLANNDCVKLAGYIETTLNIQGRCTPQRLFVLDGLVCDAVLGDPTIEALDIFNEFEAFIIDVSEPEGTNAFRMIQWIERIDALENELERFMLGGQVFPENTPMKKGWRSIFRRGSARNNGPVVDELTRWLKDRLEEFDVCSANWRRAVTVELSPLVGDEYTRKKGEIDKRKEKNKQIRDKFVAQIRERNQVSSPAGTATGSATESTMGSSTG